MRGFGYKQAPKRPKKRRNDNGGGGDDKAGGGAEDWQFLFANIREGRELHDSLRDLAAKMVKSGMNPGAVVNQLRALMKESNTPHDDRWKERYDEIPRAVESAEGLQEQTCRHRPESRAGLLLLHRGDVGGVPEVAGPARAEHRSMPCSAPSPPT